MTSSVGQATTKFLTSNKNVLMKRSTRYSKIEVVQNFFITLLIVLSHNNTVAKWDHLQLETRQLSYRKEDRAMRPIYGCPEKF